jgi:serine/threonine protein kinase
LRSTIPPPLSWASNATDSFIPEVTAPIQTLQPTKITQAMDVAPAPSTDRRKVVSHQNWVIPFEDLQLGNFLGSGSYGEVYRATWHGTVVAAKRFTFPGGSSEAKIEFSSTLLHKIKIEADLLASIRHPNVIQFLGMCSEPLCMVTEFCDQGSVFDAIRRCKKDPSLATEFTWNRRLNMLADAAAGMSHLHQRKPPILHRDLKSANLLVDSAWKVKVADLGLSKLMEEATTEAHAGSTAWHINPRWLAPEVFETGIWIPASDVYAFGATMWELLTWNLPWDHMNIFMVRYSPTNNSNNNNN